jgi:mannitol/fructose-specific phosphotransferase system IIA component (Ntr-type)
MRLQEILRPADILLGFQAADKWETIAKLLRHLGGSGRIDPQRLERFQDAVQARERSMTTGMERGLAIPHAAVDDVTDVVACLAVLADEQGVDFGSIDRRPTRLVVLLLVPRAQKLLHIRTLADIARVLGKDAVRTALLAARTQEEAWRALGAGDHE